MKREIWRLREMPSFWNVHCTHAKNWNASINHNNKLLTTSFSESICNGIGQALYEFQLWFTFLWWLLTILLIETGKQFIWAALCVRRTHKMMETDKKSQYFGTCPVIIPNWAHWKGVLNGFRLWTSWTSLKWALRQSDPKNVTINPSLIHSHFSKKIKSFSFVIYCCNLDGLCHCQSLPLFWFLAQE